MDKRVGLLILLLLALIATGAYNFHYFSNRRKPRPVAAAPRHRVSNTTRSINKNPERYSHEGSLIASTQPVTLALPEGWGRNPFLTQAEIKQIQVSKIPFPARPLPDYVVTSILISGTQKVAVINGKLVSPGDPIGMEIVKDISAEGVKLALKSMQRTIKLKQGRTKIRTRTP